MAGYLSSRQGAGAQEYGLYFKLLQRSIGGRDPAYAVAFDRCNGRYPSCSSQAARKWYGPCPWRGAFSRGRPSLWPRKTASSSSLPFDGNKYKPFDRVCQRVVSRGKGKISCVKQKRHPFGCLFLLARKEGFEPYGRCKWQVLKCRQMRSFQGFPSEPLIPLTRHLWSTSWSKRGAIRRYKAPKGKSLHFGSTPPSLPESIYDMCAKVKRIAESCAILKSIRLALGNFVTPTKAAALTR